MVVLSKRRVIKPLLQEKLRLFGNGLILHCITEYYAALLVVDISVVKVQDELEELIIEVILCEPLQNAVDAGAPEPMFNLQALSLNVVGLKFG